MDNQQGKESNELFELAYTVGFWLGDGHLTCSNGQYIVGFTKQDLGPIQKCGNQLQRVFEKELRIYTHEAVNRALLYRAALTSREAHDFFMSVTHAKTVVPQDYFTAPVEIQAQLLAGLLDSDMSVSHSNDRIRCEFCSVQSALSFAVETLCKRFRVRTGAVLFQQQRKAWRLTIRGDDLRDAKLPMVSERKLSKLRILASETLYVESCVALR